LRDQEACPGIRRSGLARSADDPGTDLSESGWRRRAGGCGAVGAGRRLCRGDAGDRARASVACGAAIAWGALAQAAAPRPAVAVVDGRVAGAVSRSGRGAAARAGHRLHCGDDRADRLAVASQSVAARVPSDAPAGDGGDPGHGRDADRDPQARGAALRQGVQGVSAAELLVGRAGRRAALGVPRRQRPGGLPAASRAEGLPGGGKGRRGAQGLSALGFGRLSARFAALLRGRPGRAVRGDRVRGQRPLRQAQGEV
jgi:hypothetical protein